MADQKASTVDKFNAQIRKLFNAFKALPAQKMMSKLHINELQSKMNTGMHTEPKYAITMLGPMLWANKDEIKAGDSKHFVDKEYGFIVQKLSKEHKFNYDDAIKTIAFMKASFSGAPEDKQKEIVDLVRELFEIYVQYVLETRKAK